ncbi:M48 family metallopeptidase [Spirulina sp. CS-785/01]|uniref:M48 family metallopeptidase n=1 Tax=Spirulina sp. CS-785/01 TaxID=3021716 RepID=UPI00232E98D6|nr:M48 family metallopeptidase [Spirulina sp. CS-785/01]MDB9312674.1 M48 family metallopeptidase [Spirulina sp. CS-785/01]
MLTPLQNTLTALLAAFTVGLTPTVSLPLLAAETPPDSDTTESSETPENPEEPTETEDTEPKSIYEKAEDDLPENLYVLYRIVERIARANDLDHQTWRVVIADDSMINAYATEANLIIVHFGLLDQVAGDASALACVVSHEMAHHTEQHIAIQTSKVAEWREELGDNDPQVQERVAELSRTHELEADALGYRYAVSAGFEAEGCLRGLDVLGRLPGTMRDSETHPAVPRRVEALEELIQEIPPEELSDRGNLGLNTSNPLTFQWLEEKDWLRINSQRGGSFVDDLNRLFGEED